MTHPRLAAPAVVALGLAGCFQDASWPDYELNVSPFKNVYLDRGVATLEVWSMDGYECLDGGTGRIYVVYPNEVATPAPMAMLLHGEVFDYVKDNREHYASVDRLSADWAADAVEALLGPSTGASANTEGALIASLLERGFYVVVPTNCWGDLWHGLSDNDYDEGFFRMGLYFADEALDWGINNLPIDPARVLVGGIGEGGRGVYELARYRGVDDSSMTALLIDSSPDWLPPVLNGDACFENSDYVTGLGLIYGIVDPAADGCVSLSQLLQPQSIGDLSVSAGFYKRPIAYWYSSIDGNVSIQLQQHALSNLPDAGLGDDLCLVDWQQDRHGFSNTDKYRSDPLVDWVMDAWNDHAEGKACPQPD